MTRYLHPLTRELLPSLAPYRLELRPNRADFNPATRLKNSCPIVLPSYGNAW